MNKNTKCITALLVTALLSYGITLDHEEEVTLVEPESTAEVIVEKTVNLVTESQHLVVKEEIQVEVFYETPTMEEEETLPIVPTETEPQPTPEPRQATLLPEIKADTEQQVP